MADRLFPFSLEKKHFAIFEQNDNDDAHYKLSNFAQIGNEEEYTFVKEGVFDRSCLDQADSLLPNSCSSDEDIHIEKSSESWVSRLIEDHSMFHLPYKATEERDYEILTPIRTPSPSPTGKGRQIPNVITPWRIEAGLDLRTTCMFRNIPNKFSQKMLISFLNETHFKMYDFVYLRMDFKNRCNVGYAFINFIEPRFIVTFSIIF